MGSAIRDRARTRVGPQVYVLGIDFCEGFWEHGRDARAAGIENSDFVEVDVQSYLFAFLVLSGQTMVPGEDPHLTQN